MKKLKFLIVECKRNDTLHCLENIGKNQRIMVISRPLNLEENSDKQADSISAVAIH